MALWSTQPLTEMSTTNIPMVIRRSGREAERPSQAKVKYGGAIPQLLNIAQGQL
jgi:hypothetical protein